MVVKNEKKTSGTKKREKHFRISLRTDDGYLRRLTTGRMMDLVIDALQQYDHPTFDIEVDTLQEMKLSDRNLRNTRVKRKR